MAMKREAKNVMALPSAAAGPSDSALARRIEGGDLAAFEQLMRRHNRALFRGARHSQGRRRSRGRGAGGVSARLLLDREVSR
jgi:hypothetical protein